MTDRVTFDLTGAQLGIIREGNWPNEQPTAWAKIQAAPVRRVGRGERRTVSLLRSSAADLADYLWSVYDVNDCIGRGEGRDMRTGNAAKAAAQAIDEALR